MYCSKKDCFEEVWRDADNHLMLCKDHYAEYQKNIKMLPKIDYSEHQTLTKDLEKKEIEK